jgi:hypothetical protein
MLPNKQRPLGRQWRGRCQGSCRQTHQSCQSWPARQPPHACAQRRVRTSGGADIALHVILNGESYLVNVSIPQESTRDTGPLVCKRNPDAETYSFYVLRFKQSLSSLTNLMHIIEIHSMIVTNFHYDYPFLPLSRIRGRIRIIALTQWNLYQNLIGMSTAKRN